MKENSNENSFGFSNTNNFFSKFLLDNGGEEVISRPEVQSEEEVNDINNRLLTLPKQLKVLMCNLLAEQITPNDKKLLTNKPTSNLIATNPSCKRKLTFSDNLNHSKDIKKAKIDKAQITDFVENILSIKISSNVLTSVDINSLDEVKLISVGRAKVKGSSKKQMRHITPYSFIEYLVKSIFNTAPNQDTIINFGKILKPLIYDISGFCFSSQTLEENKYKDLKREINGKRKKILKTSGCELSFHSPDKIQHESFTLTKRAKASKEFQDKFVKYIELALHNLAKVIDDSNTALIAAEVLSRLILGYVNSKPGMVFADEGNTQNTEIRLYTSSQAASTKQQDYTLVSVKRLKEIYNKAPSLVDQKVRIVECEGSNIAKILKLLKTVENILKESVVSLDISTQIQLYNDIGNITLILANNANVDIYNEKLTNTNYLEIMHLHLAKLIYFAFDFKALEEIVLILSTGGEDNELSIFKGATTRKLSKFIFSDGVEYRQRSVLEGKQNKKYTKEAQFRTECTNFDFLEKKLVLHFAISVIPYPGFKLNFRDDKVDFLENTFKAIIHLLALDYNLNQETEQELLTKAHSDYLSVITDTHPEIHLTNSQIELNINEQNFSHILGQHSLIEQNSDSFY